MLYYTGLYCIITGIVTVSLLLVYYYNITVSLLNYFVRSFNAIHATMIKGAFNLYLSNL